MVIAAAALLAGLADLILVLSSDHFTDRAWAAFGPLVGWSFVGTGMYAQWRRPESRFGALMVVLGFTWFLAPLGAADSPLLFTLGIVLGSIWGAVLAHVLLSFPSGRLASGRRRALVIAGYVLVPLAPVPGMLFSESDKLSDCDGPCPANLLLLEADEQLGVALLAAGAAVVVTLCLLVVGFLVARWRGAGPSERRSLAPLFGAGAGTLLLVLAYAATEVPAFRTLAFASFAATPFAFLAGLARADFSHARGVRSLVARLTDLPAPGDLRGALAVALGDPTFEPRVLGARAGPLRRRARPWSGGAARGPCDDRDRARRAADRRDRARSRARRRPGDGASGGGGDRAAARQPAPRRGAAGQHARAARVTRAARRGR